MHLTSKNSFVFLLIYLFCFFKPQLCLIHPQQYPSRTWCWRNNIGYHPPLVALSPSDINDNENNNNNNNAENESDNVEFDSLDVVLERARKRRPSAITKLFGAMAQPITTMIPWLSRLDVLYLVVAIGLNSNGFALGYVIGKSTNRYVLGLFPLLSPKISQLWPVILAVCIDQIL